MVRRWPELGVRPDLVVVLPLGNSFTSHITSDALTKQRVLLDN